MLGCTGFGPHAMRHIVATYLVKTNRNFTDASRALHDSEATVRNFYGHLLAKDVALAYSAGFAESFKGL